MIKIEELRSMLHYDPASGEFRWLSRRSQRVRQGAIAGYTTNRGYRAIGICGHYYLAHQLAWFYVHGIWPECCLDHINRQPGDNRIANLRLATQSENQANVGKRSDNNSGLKGVAFHRATGKWQTQINYHGRSIYLGLHETPEKANIVYRAKALELFGDFAEDR